MGAFAWEHGAMAAIQSLSHMWGGAFDAFFLACTFLGEAGFLALLVALLYWCVDKRMGEALLLSTVTSAAANGVLKDLFRRPRPFLNPDFADLGYLRISGPLVDTAHLGQSWSFPSGHSQGAASTAAALGLWSGRRRWAILGAALTILVMASRVYLGVHYPTDTIAGALAGVLISWGIWRVLRRFPERRLWVFAAVVGLTSLTLLGSPAPDTVRAVGLGAGALAGLWLEERRIGFSTQGPALRRALRLALGLVLLFLIQTGLRELLPQGPGFLWLRYAGVGFVATGGWPFLFTRLGL